MTLNVNVMSYTKHWYKEIVFELIVTFRLFFLYLLEGEWMFRNRCFNLGYVGSYIYIYIYISNDLKTLFLFQLGIAHSCLSMSDQKTKNRQKNIT